VGLGPGGPGHRTYRAVEAIQQSEVVVGYTRYLESIADLTAGKRTIASGMTHEVDRCRSALAEAAEGRIVSLVSSGDAGVYGMAGLAIELAEAEHLRVPIEVIPGVTAATAAAAALGAPLMLDFAAISLSDLLVPWETIRRRLEAVAAADLVVCLYNPRSSRRTRQLAMAAEIFRRARPGATPVGIVTNAGQAQQRVVVTDLDHLPEEEVDMQAVVVVGNTTTRLVDAWMVTARGYSL
jgi:precorrin-3B C17-methyltransferase